MGSVSDPDGADRTSSTSPATPAGEEELFTCDFCGKSVPQVRRVALDSDYERLRTPHRERYACEACSERKEQERIGL